VCSAWAVLSTPRFRIQPACDKPLALYLAFLAPTPPMEPTSTAMFTATVMGLMARSTWGRDRTEGGGNRQRGHLSFVILCCVAFMVDVEQLDF
jgi:hypothetical protein